MGLLAGFLAAAYCYIGTGVAFAAVGVPSGGAGIPVAVATGALFCDTIITAATIAPSP